ncbi:MAG: nitroreductase family protein [Thaumarchaeota archaeon]|nr:nitroreductase family protein [Nitrososphaerota archaeon]
MSTTANHPPTRQFDTGSAWENLAIQATSQGLSTHAMQGFDYDKAKKDLEVPDVIEVVAMVAIGKKPQKKDYRLNSNSVRYQPTGNHLMR